MQEVISKHAKTLFGFTSHSAPHQVAGSDTLGCGLVSKYWKLAFPLGDASWKVSAGWRQLRRSARLASVMESSGTAWHFHWWDLTVLFIIYLRGCYFIHSTVMGFPSTSCFLSLWTFRLMKHFKFLFFHLFIFWTLLKVVSACWREGIKNWKHQFNWIPFKYEAIDVSQINLAYLNGVLLHFDLTFPFIYLFFLEATTKDKNYTGIIDISTCTAGSFFLGGDSPFLLVCLEKN